MGDCWWCSTASCFATVGLTSGTMCARTIMQFTNDPNWTSSKFAFFKCLLFILLIQFFSSTKEILQDDNIIKVGVQPCSDAAYLAKDYGVCVASTLDLRYLAVECGYRPGGLAQLSMEHLKVQLDKNWRVRCSDWEAETLMNMQIEYAAKDAHVGVELFRKFADKLKPKKLFENHTKHLKAFIDEYCFKYLDASFSGGMVHRPNMKGEQSSKSSL